MNELLKRLYEIENSIPNLHILNQSSLVIDDICIIGCTLWSKLEVQLPKYIVRIYGITSETYNKKHEEELDYVKKMIKYAKDNDLKTLVITHYCPTFKVLENCVNRDKFSSLYASNLEELLDSSKVNTWVCGHIHRNFDFKTQGGTRIVGNQKGKPKDKIEDFSKNFLIEV
jgi:predicted phosphohydrolase